jgi:hypothetical protein
MKKKYIAPVAIALIATISITTASCGKPADEEVNATEAEVTTTVESTEETTAPETTETETTVEETTVAETTKEETTPATESASNKTAKNTETKAATKNETKAETKAAPKAETPKAPAPTQAAPAPTAAPVHEHQWKEHKATRQEWVSNIVSVPDYETREEVMGYIICNCGAEFKSGDPSFSTHAANHILAGEPDNYRSEVRVIGTETVQVGSHDEDQGYYQNVEYTDYHYCDCGATK